MRRILALVALAVSAWYLSNRRRRAQIQSSVQDMMSSLLGARSHEATATLDKMAAAKLDSIDDREHDVGTQAAPEPTEQGAVRSADTATSGALGGEAMVAEGVTDVGGTREGEAAEEGSAPEGQRPRPVAGAGTTRPEELPPELTPDAPGEPGAGGP